MLLLVGSTLIFLSLANAQAVVCPQGNQTGFINSNLAEACGDALMRLQFMPSPRPNITVPTLNPADLVSVSAQDLNRACTASCAGAYSMWLRDGCQDPYTARAIDVMCLSTAESTVGIGSRCRFGFPDAIDTRRLFLQITTFLCLMSA